MSNSATHPASSGLRARYFAGAMILAGVGALLGAGYYLQSPATANLPPPLPPAVTVSPPLQKDVAQWTQFTGQFSAVDSVQIRAQVSGYLTEIDFTDGQMVHQGDLLFVIDPRPFQIQLQQANAAVQTAKANLLFAQKETWRIGTLQDSGAVTKEQLDQRVEQQAAAQAALQQATAAVASAQLNIEFCHIRAPFTGRISTHRVSIGNLIDGGASAADPTLLTTLVSVDPIHLDFQMSEDDYLNYQQYLHSAGHPVDNTVGASLSDESGFTRIGKLDFIDNAVDTGSGTIHARATFANRDQMITPGEFAELRLPTAAARPVLLIPDSALAADQSDEVAMTVDAAGTVVPKIVQIGALDHGLREVVSGLSPRDRVVIDGLVNAQPGAKVTPQAGSVVAQN